MFISDKHSSLWRSGVKDKEKNKCYDISDSSKMEEGWLKSSSNAVFGHNAMPNPPKSTARISDDDAVDTDDAADHDTSQRKISTGHDDEYAYEDDYYYEDELVTMLFNISSLLGPLL